MIINGRIIPSKDVSIVCLIIVYCTGVSTKTSGKQKNAFPENIIGNAGTKAFFEE
jgi:hypothetical protein